MDLNLKGRCALVTGAGRGIGRAIARALAAEGVRIVAVARSQDDLDSLVAELDGSQHIAIALDLMQADAVQRLHDELNDNSASTDIAIHNLGGTLDITDPFCPIEQWREVMRFNFEIAVEINRLLVPHMQSQKWGRVVQIGSTASVELNGPATYAAAKAALCAYTRCVGRLLAADGVIMTALLPGVVKTEGGYWETALETEPERVEEYIKSRCPLKRFGTPDEIAHMVTFLCSDKASFNPGAVIPIDGGQLRGYEFS